MSNAGMVILIEASGVEIDVDSRRKGDGEAALSGFGGCRSSASAGGFETCGDRAPIPCIRVLNFRFVAFMVKVDYD